MNSLYCTADKIGIETGGGIVTYNELLALKKISSSVTVIERKDIAPTNFHQPNSPFLEDYFALEQIKDKHFDLAHFYSGCFSQTIGHLKNNGTRVSYTVAAHDRAKSISEFHRLGLEYPFHHISDDSLWKIYSEGYRLADVVIAPSRKSAEILKSDVGCRNVVVIPHGVNLPRRVKPIPERFDVCYVGATGPDKGLIDLILAWNMLNYQDSRLIIAGEGSENLEPFIRQVARSGQFVLLGRVPDASVVYDASSVAVFPSVTEGFGIGILEAMASGRPVIAAEGAGASELIDDGIGFTVPIRSPEAIAERVNQLKSLPFDKLVEMGQRARKKARNYTWHRIRQRYIRTWEKPNV